MTAPDTEIAKPAHSSDLTSSGVTVRVVILCLLLAVGFGYVIPIIDIKLYNTFLGSTHLPPGAIAALLILLLVINPSLHLLSRLLEQTRRGRSLALTRNEALTVYISGLFSALVPGHGSASLFVSQIIGSFYYATRENRWLDFLQPYLKPWLTPALTGNGVYNPKPVQAWYVGLGAQGEAIPWGAWLVPLTVWGSLIFATYLMLGCLSVMLRAQWAEREALAFPLLRLPLEMTAGSVGVCEYGSMGGNHTQHYSPTPPHSHTPIPPYSSSSSPSSCAASACAGGCHLKSTGIPIIPMSARSLGQ